MSEAEVKKFILDQLESRFRRLSFVEKYMLTDFNLVQTGILDSMQFIELVAALEKRFKVEINFENQLPETFTTLSGLTELIVRSHKNNVSRN